MNATVSTSPSTSDPRRLATLPDILARLSAIQSDESELSAALAGLLSAHEPIAASLNSLKSLAPPLDALVADTRLFDQTVSFTARTAQDVGGRVQSLDEEMRRVREASERVSQIIELKSSLAALQSSIDQQDWEAATRHCARAMALPLDVISGPFAETAVPTPESHLPPAQTLQAAREQLLAVFRREFDKASRARDANATSRFFKLFPAIGWEAEGLQAYASFVVELVKVRPPASAKTSSPLYYITALTALFESIALIVDQHQPVVEKYYGVGKMGLVLERLLQEADRVVKDLVEGWEEERSMKRKLSDISSTPLSAGIRPNTAIDLVDEDLVDAREIDKVLTEAASMSGRWGLFRKFMHDRLTEDIEDDEDDGDEDTTHARTNLTNPSRPPSNSGGEDTIPAGFQVVEDSQACKTIENMLTTYYTPLEVWYTRCAIEKAHRLSTHDLSQTPITTTTPDDAFYILKSVLSRMLSTASAATVERTSNQLRDVMDKDYSRVIKQKLDNVYKGGSAGPGARGEKAERENRQSFIILLNDLDVSSSHMERLAKDLAQSAHIPQHFLDSEVDAVRASLNGFVNLVPKFRSTLRAGVEQLFNQLLRPKLRTFIPDVYKDVSYVLDEDGYSGAELQDLVRKRFVKAWEGLIEGYKDAFTESNYRLFFGLALDVLVRPWEKFVVGLKYSELGAIRFDHDLRAVVAYLSSQTVFGDVREKFVRLQQIGTLLNLDSEEDVDEFYNGSGIAWQLSQQEARAVANLRV
ncbi:COG4-domain-containing protein [Trametes versicolor FP-101664 SS1]|uniref:COG4-domain-containing protein n=1 Tax=Trametes versicolor (strain FP-101664) TaxID=717944 RepID=UPI000462254B|nr:COG4-domain-containing protein [Trametes versicolor FP-101664 SS1]EIW60719.1 COG4-domain-containing protein [Trametes versicolor FP-101664 SS1]